MSTARRHQRRSRVGFWVIAIAVAFAWAGVATWSRRGAGCTSVSAGSDALVLKVEALSAGSARKYCLKTADSRTVRLIVARGSDGNIRVILDACRTCYRNNLGYRLSGREIICRFCANRYSIDSISASGTSCMPLAMPFEEHAGLLRIRLADLKKAEAFFPAESPVNELAASALRWFARLMHKQERGVQMLSNAD